MTLYFDDYKYSYFIIKNLFFSNIFLKKPYKFIVLENNLIDN